MQMVTAPWRAVLVLLSSAALACITGCAADDAPVRMPIIIATEDDASREGYVAGHLHNPELYARERDLLARREELLINWATRQSLDSANSKVRAIAPPLQLTGDERIDRNRTYHILLVADDIPPGSSFLRHYEVRVAPNPLVAVVMPAVTAHSLVSADLVAVQEKLGQLAVDRATVEADLAQRQAFLTGASVEVDAAIANAKTGLTAQQSALAQAEAARGAALSGSASVVGALRARQARDDAEHRVKQLTAAVAATNNELAAIGTEAPKGDTDAGKAQLKLWNELTARKAQEEAELKKATASADAAAKKFEAAEKVVADAQEAADLTRQTQLIQAHEQKVARARARVEASERAIRDLQALKRSDLPLKSAKGWYDVMLQYYTAERDRLTELAKDSTDAQYTIPTAVAVSVRADDLKKGEQLRIEVLRRDAATQGAAVAAAATAALVPPTSTPPTMLAPPRAPTAPGVPVAAAAGVPPSGNPDDQSRVPTAAAGKAVSDLQNELKSYEQLLAEARKIYAMTRSSISRQSQLDLLEHATANWGILRGQLLAAGAALTPEQKQALRAALASAGVATAAPPAKRPPGKSSPPLAAPPPPADDAANPIAQLTSVSLLTPVAELTPAKAAEKVEQIDRLRTVVAYLQAALGSSPEAVARSKSNFEQLIANGDLSVFRFNVLRGVVRTTGYILAHDGASLMFGKAFAARFYVVQVTLRNPEDKPILVYGNTMRFVVRMNGRRPGERAEDGLPVSYNWWATVQPIGFEAVERMVEGEQETSWQRRVLQALELTGVGLGIGTAFSSSLDFAKGVALFTGVATPAARELLEADLRRHRKNFQDTSLNPIEEIPAGGILTRHVFLPKGPIYGSWGYDVTAAQDLTAAAAGRRGWGAADEFGKKALVPIYIHDIRREEVYVDGKRILASDPLTAIGAQ